MTDVKMNVLKNWPVMTAIAAVAQYPSFVRRLFLPENTVGKEKKLYGVTLYIMGEKTTIMVDDYLPVFKKGFFKKIASFVTSGRYGGPTGFSAQIGPEEGLWVALLEKAFAKVHGNYMHLEWKSDGSVANIISMMTGQPFKEKVHNKARVKSQKY